MDLHTIETPSWILVKEHKPQNTPLPETISVMCSCGLRHPVSNRTMVTTQAVQTKTACSCQRTHQIIFNHLGEPRVIDTGWY